MIEEIVHSNPKEFELERFDILAKLQHFGFPTRLLDVTSNPLVALYFACSDKEELAQDGAVYVLSLIHISVDRSVYEMKIAVTYDNGNIFQHFGRTESFKDVYKRQLRKQGAGKDGV